MEVCGTSILKIVLQEPIRLRLFPFSLMGKAIKWLAKLPRNSIASWQELLVEFVDNEPTSQDDELSPDVVE